MHGTPVPLPPSVPRLATHLPNERITNSNTQLLQGVDLARGVTDTTWTRVQDLARTLYLELTSKGPVLDVHRMVTLSPEVRRAEGC